MSTGIRARHQRGCASTEGGTCSCTPSWQAEAFDSATGKKIRKTFSTHAAAKSWRADTMVAIRQGRRRGPSGITVKELGEAFVDGAKDASIRNRSGDPFKPSVIRGYEAALKNRVYPAMGHRKVDTITAIDVQDFADELKADGLGPSSVRNILMPLRVIFRRAMRRGIVGANPVSGVELDAVRGKRDRIATPDEAAKLIAAVPLGDRPIWATAVYAGLRRGELQALRWGAVNLGSGVIEVRASYDSVARQHLMPKSRAGERRVPLPAVLRDYLDAHLLSLDATPEPDDLVFPGPKGNPFHDSALGKRARAAWNTAGLSPITLHECRHTYASVMIAAGVNAKALCTYMGHANISITFDRYGHLMPGSEAEAAGLLDRYLSGAISGAQVARA
jgi:integrase